SHAERTALTAAEGSFTYRDLLDASARVAACLLGPRDDLREARVAFLASPGWHYVATQWGIWRAGGVAVRLATSHPPPELEYVIEDADVEILVAAAEFAPRRETGRAPPPVRPLSTTGRPAGHGRSALPPV